MAKYTNHGELSHEEIARCAKAWSIGCNIIIKMSRDQAALWTFPKYEKQIKLNLDEQY